MNIYSSFPHNCPNLEAIEMLFSRRMNCSISIQRMFVSDFFFKRAIKIENSEEKYPYCEICENYILIPNMAFCKRQNHSLSKGLGSCESIGIRGLGIGVSRWSMGALG